VPDSTIASFTLTSTLKLALAPIRNGSTETERFVEDTVDVVEGFVEENVRHDCLVRGGNRVEDEAVCFSSVSSQVAVDV
jgi:hypothetical protein